MCNAIHTAELWLQKWLSEGVTIEVDTLFHPNPILGNGNFQAAVDTFHGGVDLLNHIPGNRPVVFRTPCCDSMNTPSPRLFTEIFFKANKVGQFLKIDSSVFNVTNEADSMLPRELHFDSDDLEKFWK